MPALKCIHLISHFLMPALKCIHCELEWQNNMLKHDEKNAKNYTSGEGYFLLLHEQKFTPSFQLFHAHKLQ